MIDRYFYFVLLLSLVLCACSRSKGPENFLVVSSMDGEQVKKVDAEEAQIHWATAIDTADYYPEEDRYSYHVVLSTESNGDLPDSNCFVIKIKTIELGYEGEPTLLLYARFVEGRLTEVYYTEIGELICTWMAVETYVAVVREDGRPRVKLDGVVETVKFGLACYIGFPLNKDGLYDDIPRYMRIHAEFEVPEDVFKLLGQAAEPPVKPVVRDSTMSVGE